MTKRHALGLAVLGILGCAGASHLDSPSGSWTLTSVNGQPLPFPLSNAGTTQSELVSSVVVFDGRGRAITTTTARVIINGQPTTERQVDTSSYSVSGNSLSITHRNATTRMTLDGARMSGANPQNGFLLVFTRR